MIGDQNNTIDDDDDDDVEQLLWKVVGMSIDYFVEISYSLLNKSDKFI